MNIDNYMALYIASNVSSIEVFRTWNFITPVGCSTAGIVVPVARDLVLYGQLVARIIHFKKEYPLFRMNVGTMERHHEFSFESLKKHGMSAVQSVERYFLLNPGTMYRSAGRSCIAYGVAAVG